MSGDFGDAWMPGAPDRALAALLDSPPARATGAECEVVTSTLRECREAGLLLPRHVEVRWRKGAGSWCSPGACEYSGGRIVLYLQAGLPLARLHAVARHEAYHANARMLGLPPSPDEERGAAHYAGECA